MAKSKAISAYGEGEPIVMRGRLKFADIENGRLTVTLEGYEIPITTHMRNIEKGGPAPKSNGYASVSR